jgi:hypothetical protein
MQNQVRVENNERIDRSDFEAIAQVTPQDHAVEGPANFSTNPAGTRAWIVGGFKADNPTAAQLRVQLGVAILAFRNKGAVAYGALTTSGDAQKILDLAGFADGTYNIYVRFEYVDGTFENRVFWNPATPAEFTQSIPTKRLANWSLRAGLVSPGADWLQTAEVVVLAGAITAITNKRPLYFEGLEFVATAASGAAAVMGAPGAGVIPVTGLTGMTAASRGKYLHLPNGTGLNAGLHRIVARTSAAEVDIDDKGATVPGSEAVGDWAETDSFRSAWGTAADRNDDRGGPNGIQDLQTFVAFVMKKLEEIQTGDNPIDYPGSRVWDDTPDSLDNKLSLNGNPSTKPLGSIVFDTDEQATLPSSGDDITIGAGVLDLAGSAEISMGTGPLQMAGGELTMTGASNIAIDGTGSLTIASAGAVLNGDGVLTLNGTGSGGIVLNNDGSITLNGTGSGDITVNDDGDIILNGSGSSNITVNNSGDITANGGEIKAVGAAALVRAVDGSASTTLNPTDVTIADTGAGVVIGPALITSSVTETVTQGATDKRFLKIWSKDIDLSGVLDVGTFLDLTGGSAVTGDVLPSAGTYKLGTPGNPWAEVNADEVDVTNIYVGADAVRVQAISDVVVVGTSIAGEGAGLSVIGGDTITGASAEILSLQTEYVGTKTAGASAKTGVTLATATQMNMMRFVDEDATITTGSSAAPTADVTMWFDKDHISAHSGSVRVTLRSGADEIAGWIRVYGRP